MDNSRKFRGPEEEVGGLKFRCPTGQNLFGAMEKPGAGRGDRWIDFQSQKPLGVMEKVVVRLSDWFPESFRPETAGYHGKIRGPKEEVGGFISKRKLARGVTEARN